MNLMMLTIAGALLWVLQVVMRRSVDVVSVTSAMRERFRKALPGTLAALWLGYVWLVFYVLVGTESYYPYLAGGLLVLLVGLVGWYVLRDIVAGVAFLTKHPGILKHRLSILGVHGKVVRLGPTSLSLRTDTGQILSIPYSRIAGESFTDHSQSTASDRFTLSLAVGDDSEPNELAHAIRTDLMLLPWTNAHFRPHVRIVRTDGKITAEITYHSLNEEHAARVGQHIKGKYERVPSPAAKKNQRSRKA